MPPLGSTAINSGSGPESSWRVDFELPGVDDVHDVAVAGGDIDFLAVGAGDDAARPARGGDGLDHFERLTVDHRDGIVLLVGDEDLQGKGGEGGARRAARRRSQSEWGVSSPVPFACLVGELALGLGLVVAERVGEEFRVQEAFLRRHRHERAGAGDQHRLAELMVPVAERQPLALEGGDGELRRREGSCECRQCRICRTASRLRRSSAPRSTPNSRARS